jgi:oligopeptide transport system ATP-binding protein
MQIIFQDPMSSLDPRWTVDRVLAEPLKIHTDMSKQDIKDRVCELMEVVGLSPYQARKYPHEFSGGQRQRIGLARALALNPKFIVCDEPVSALDVSIQSQVLNLMRDLQEKFALTYLFISHDLSVVKYVSNRIAVMYLGRIVETGESEALFRNRLHPYTQALFSAIPMPDPHVQRKRRGLPGDVPTPASPPSGCAFHPRCARCMPVCKDKTPRLEERAPGYFVSCHLYAPSAD